MKQGACYIRVSTDDQTELSPNTQIAEIQKYAKEHDILLNKEFIYMDEGISGRKTKNRPAFQKMIGVAKSKPKPFDVILLWKFSRFARNQEEAVVYKSLLRKECGIDVVSITEPIDDSPFGSLIERIIEWFDAYYSIRLGEDVKRSMTEKARRGEMQAATPFGYVKKKGQPLEICESEARWVRYIFQAFADGSSFFAIARHLNNQGVRTKQGNQFENRSIEYMIHNPFYIGYVRWTPEGKTVGKRIWDSPNTITEKSNHKPIISQELWDTCQEILAQRKANRKVRERPAETKQHWMVGLLKCGTCGSTMTYSAASNGFQCNSYSKGTCSRSHFITLPKIEKMVYTALEEIQADTAYLEHVKLVTDHEDQIRDLQRQIARSETMLDRAKAAYIEGLDSIEEYKGHKLRLTGDIEMLQKQLSALHSNAAPDVKQMQKTIQNTISLLKDPDIAHEKKYNAVRDIVETITFKRPEEEVNIYLFRRV